MATGDVTNLKRVRFQTNERLDLVDANPLSQVALDQAALSIKALHGKPLALAGQPFPTGCGLMVNKPLVSAAAAFQVSIGSNLVVAIDSDGKLIVKESGLTQVVSGGATGTQYLYMYRDEVATNNETRRFLPASGPFNEFTAAMNTRFAGTFGFVFGAVGAPLVVEGAVGAGQFAFCSIGQATFNGGGTLTGFSFTDNFLATAADPSTFSFPVDSVTPSQVTDALLLSKALLALVSNLNWGGVATAHTSGVAKGRSNNYYSYKSAGAFRPGAPVVGLEETNRLTLGAVTVGDGANTFGNIDATDFASHQALFKFMFENAGTYALKPGSVFTFAGDCVPAAGGSLTAPFTRIYGQHVTVNFGAHVLNMTKCAGARFYDMSFVSAANGGFRFPDVAGIGNIQFRHCLFSGTDTPIIFGDTTAANELANIEIDDCDFAVGLNGDVTATGACVDLAAAEGFNLRRSRFTINSAGFVGSAVRLLKVKNSLVVEGNFFEQNGGDDTAFNAPPFANLLEITSVAISPAYRVRRIQNNQFCGTPTGSAVTHISRSRGILMTDVSDVLVSGNTFSRCRTAIEFDVSVAGTNQNTNATIIGNTIARADEYGFKVDVSAFVGTLDGLRIQNNSFNDVKQKDAVLILGSASTTLRNLRITGNDFCNINEDTAGLYSARNGRAVHLNSYLSLVSATIDGNTFLNCANTPVHVEGTQQILSLSVQNNRFENTETPEALNCPTYVTSGSGTYSAFGVLVNGAGVGGQISHVTIAGNTFEDSFTFNSNTFSSPCMAIVTGSLLRNVVVRDNTLGNIGASYSGAALAAGWLLVAETTTDVMDGVSVCRNVVAGTGKTAIKMALVQAVASTLTNVDISGNQLAFVGNTGLDIGSAVSTTITRLNGQGITTVKFSNNVIRSLGTANLAAHMYESDAAGGTPGNNGLQIQGNLFFANTGWAISGGKGFGVHLNGRNAFNYSVQNNEATRTAYGGSDVAPLFYGPFSPTIPSPAVEGNGGTTIVSDYVGYNTAGQNADGSAGSGVARNRGWSRI